MRRLLHSVVLTIVLAGLAPAAQALNPLFLSAKTGESSLTIGLAEGLGSEFVGDDGSFGLGLGVSLGKYVVFQAEYQDLGTVSAMGSPCTVVDPEVLCIAQVARLEADSTGVTLSFMPHLPLTKRLSLYGKLGYVSWDSDISAVQEASQQFLGTLEREDAVIGGGLRIFFPGPLGLFVEYENLGDIFEMISVGATLGL